MVQIRNHFGSGVAVSLRRTAFWVPGAMGSKAALGDIQRFLANLNRQLGSVGPEGGRQGKGHGKGANPSGNWDCPHCCEGTDNFANSSRCFKCGENRPKDPPAKTERPKQVPRAHSRPAKPSAPPPAPTPHPKMDAMEVEDHQEDATSELATARSLHEWARKLPQPARDKEFPAARKRFELAEGEDKKRKPPAERLQSALSRVDHRQRQAQAARDALAEAEQAIEAFKAECAHQETLLAKDQEKLQVAQSLHQVWGPSAREGEPASQLGKQPQDTEAAAEKTERQRDLLNRLYDALPAGQGPDLFDFFKELAGSPGTAATQKPAQEQQAAPPTPEGEGVEASGPKKTPKQVRVKSQGSYARPGEGASGAGARGHCSQGAQEEGAAERTADHCTEAADAEQL